jgi:hypothetical protein
MMVKMPHGITEVCNSKWPLNVDLKYSEAVISPKLHLVCVMISWCANLKFFYLIAKCIFFLNLSFCFMSVFVNIFNFLSAPNDKDWIICSIFHILIRHLFTLPFLWNSCLCLFLFSLFVCMGFPLKWLCGTF